MDTLSMMTEVMMSREEEMVVVVVAEEAAITKFGTDWGRDKSALEMTG